MNTKTDPLVHELRERIHSLERESIAKQRLVEELREAIAALLEPGMPRIVRSQDGVTIMDARC